jgi:helicase MOV-10
VVDVQEHGTQHWWAFSPWFCLRIFFHQYQYLRSIEIENDDEDLLPEVVLGDFVWLDDIQADIRYGARIAKIEVYQRSQGHLAVLKMSLRVPTDFDLQQGALLVLRFRLDRITLRRQYHALASLSTGNLPPRLLFPSAADIGSIQHLSRAEIDNLDLANGNIRNDDQQLHTVVSILEQPQGSVPFIIYGP